MVQCIASAKMFTASSFLRRLTAISTIQVRGRRRDHAQRQLAKRNANRLKRQQEKDVPKLTKFEQMMAKKATSAAAASQQYPARPLTVSDLPAKPTRDDISWIVADYQPQLYSMQEALTYLREVNHPNILNRPDAFVHMRLDLNMKLEKATRFVTDTSKVVVFPHPYPHSEKRLILAFAKDIKQQTEAADAGAEIVGGPELIKKIIKGVLRIDDVDYVACHADMLQEVAPLRGLLKSRFPTIKGGNISLDVAALVRYFQFGVKVQIKADKRYPEYGICLCNIGKLDWPDEQLENNVNALIKEISDLRPPKPKLGQFVDRAVLMVPPEPDYFIIDHSLYVPPMPLEDEEDAGKKKRKSKKKADVALEEPVETTAPEPAAEEDEQERENKSASL